ncbi:hypothetical protein ACYVVD_04335 [Arenicellales bacterium IMCC58067]
MFHFVSSLEHVVVKKIKANIDPVESQLRFEANFYGDWYSESVLAAYLAEESADSPESPLADLTSTVSRNNNQPLKN